ncbi:DUF1003 domain-containing protein, partial [Lacticaseibacillus rhamnosus]
DRRQPRLDQPRVPGRSRLPSPDPEAFGRLSERIARFLGTGKFLVAQTGVIFLWIIWNIVVPKSARFDAYPFQFLTLVLSLQAAYAAPAASWIGEKVKRSERHETASRNSAHSTWL